MEIRGTGIGQGVAVGPVVRMADALPEPVDRPSHLDPEREGERARASLSVVAAELANRGAKAGGAAKDVLEAQSMMAEDPSLIDEVTKLLATGKTAERAVYEAFAAYRDLLAGMGGYMAERAADLDDISQRVIAHLLKLPPPGVPNPGHPFVLVARDLAPADTAMLDLDQVLGLVTSDGGPDVAHRDPRPREEHRRGGRGSGCREPRRRRHGRGRRGRRPRGLGSDPRAGRARQRAHRRARRARGGARHARRARRRHARAAAREPRLGRRRRRGAQARRRGRRPVPHRVPLPRRRHRARACASSRSTTRGSSRRSRAGRWSCACSTRAPTSRCRSSTTRTRRTRRSGSAASVRCAIPRSSSASSSPRSPQRMPRPTPSCG